MKSTVVYKITRKDDMEYIGITVDRARRFKAHEKSNRFSIGIKNVEILAECDTYEEAEDLEEYYIEKYDTFNNGLNTTYNGKGKTPNCKFNTLGYVYSEESRTRMSESAKRRGATSTGWKHSDYNKKRWSEERSGKYFGNNKKVPDEDSKIIYESYVNNTITFSEDFIKKYVKKNHVDLVGKVELKELRSPNGKPLSLSTLYSHYYASKYNTTVQAIRRILKNKGIRCEEY